MITEQLREDALHEVNILTSPTEQELDKIERTLKEGMYLLNTYAGTTIDYETNLLARNLLIAFVRYDYTGNSEYFEQNYMKRINSFIDHVAIEEFKKDKEEVQP